MLIDKWYPLMEVELSPPSIFCVWHFEDNRHGQGSLIDIKGLKKETSAFSPFPEIEVYGIKFWSRKNFHFNKNRKGIMV